MQSFGGFWPALVTPYTPDDEINLPVLLELVDYMLGKRVTGLYICGSTGEGAFQSAAERRQVAEAVLKHVNGRMPVIVHVGAASLKEACGLAQHARAHGAAAISSIVPPVVYDARGIGAYFARLAQAAPELPFLPYLFGGTRDVFSLLNELKDIPNFTGTKYFGPNMYELSQLVTFRSRDWTVFNGMDEQAVLGLMYGAHGVIGSTLNFMPGAYGRMTALLQDGKAGEALAMQQRANAITRLLLEAGFVGGMRMILTRLGFAVGAPRLPNLALPEGAWEALLPRLLAAGLDELVAL